MTFRGEGVKNPCVKTGIAIGLAGLE